MSPAIVNAGIAMPDRVELYHTMYGETEVMGDNDCGSFTELLAYRAMARKQLRDQARRILILEEESHERGERVIALAHQRDDARRQLRELEAEWEIVNARAVYLARKQGMEDKFFQHRARWQD